MILSAILSILGSSTVGTILGGVFAIWNHKVDLDAKRIDYEHEVARWGHDLAVKDKDLEYAKVEAAGRKDVAITEADGAIETARMGALAAAQTADAISADDIKAAGWWSWSLVLVAAYNKLVRPVATTVLLVVAVRVNLEIMAHLLQDAQGLAPEVRSELANRALDWITVSASATLGYWFVIRSKTNGPAK